MDKTLDSHEMFDALIAWANADSKGCRSGGGAFDFVQLHSRPDPREPERQLTFQAALVDGRPVIQVRGSIPPERPNRSPMVSGRAFAVDDTGSLGRDAEAVCEGCGAIGTIGRASRTDASGRATEAHRFCFDCWPEQSARYRGRWTEEDRRRSDRFLRGLAPAGEGAGPGMAFEAATWHTALEIVREIEQTMVAPIPPSPHDLEQFAAEIQGSAWQLEGEMPYEVEAFIQRYGSRAG